MSGYRVYRIALVNVSAFVIYRPGEAILVDCGNSGSEDKILKIFDHLGLEPDDYRGCFYKIPQCKEKEYQDTCQNIEEGKKVKQGYFFPGLGIRKLIGNKQNN